MSLKHKLKKIKCFYALLFILLIFNILVFVSLLTYLFLNLYKNDGPEYVFNAFEVAGLYKTLDLNNKIEPDNSKIDETWYIMASKNGTKYYYQNCSGINRIKKENRVYFDDYKGAEKEGYQLAKNCKKP